MGQHYQQLTKDERNQIYALRKARIPMTQITELLGRSRSTLYRELKRNTGRRGYRPRQAQHLAAKRERLKTRDRKMTPSVVAYIQEKLRLQWSPEQIAEVMKTDPDGPGLSVSHERIYQYVWTDKRNGGIWYKHLRHSSKKRRKRYGSKDSRGKIRNRVDIEQRPAVVEKRVRLGDWEADLVSGAAASGHLVTLVERISRRTKIGFTTTKFADEVTEEILRLLASEVVETITFDNGKEFAGHERIAATLDCQCYFAKPYHSWERGLNENTNGLIRQYFPKKTSFATITAEQIAFVEHRLNRRPRKCLDFKPPDDVYFALAA